MRPGHWMILLILVAVPFATGLPHGFVYDDHGSIAENPFLDEPGNLRKLLTFQTLTDSSIPDGRRPLVILSYLLDRAVWGSKPFGYHLTNLLLHLIVVVLVFVLVRRAQPERGPFLAFAAALLYGLHPVLTEPVQCPAFREDILLTLFVLLFLLATTRQRTVWLLDSRAGARLARQGIRRRRAGFVAVDVDLLPCGPAAPRHGRRAGRSQRGPDRSVCDVVVQERLTPGGDHRTRADGSSVSGQPSDRALALGKRASRSGMAAAVDRGLRDRRRFRRISDWRFPVGVTALLACAIVRSPAGPSRAVDCFRHGLDADRLRAGFQYCSSL